MFAEYNHDHYPVIFVNFSESIESEDEFDQFLNEWLLLYHNQRDFSFIFDTRNMKNIYTKRTLIKSKLKNVP